MPRDGYESVTLPEDLLDELERAARQDESRADVIERLLSGEGGGVREFAVASDDVGLDDLDERLGRIEDVLDGLPGRVTDELAREFGPSR